jgi:hypothetical protein
MKDFWRGFADLLTDWRITVLPLIVGGIFGGVFF